MEMTHRELPGEEPVLVIEIDPSLDVFPPAAEARLRGLIGRLQAEPTLRIRLAVYVPDEGSRSLNLAVAEGLLDKTRQLLARLRMPARRLVAASMGEEYPAQRSSTNSWLEFYEFHVGPGNTPSGGRDTDADRGS